MSVGPTINGTARATFRPINSYSPRQGEYEYDAASTCQMAREEDDHRQRRALVKMLTTDSTNPEASHVALVFAFGGGVWRMCELAARGQGRCFGTMRHFYGKIRDLGAFREHTKYELLTSECRGQAPGGGTFGEAVATSPAELLRRCVSHPMNGGPRTLLGMDCHRWAAQLLATYGVRIPWLDAAASAGRLQALRNSLGPAQGDVLGAALNNYCGMRPLPPERDEKFWISEARRAVQDDGWMDLWIYGGTEERERPATTQPCTCTIL